MIRGKGDSRFRDTKEHGLREAKRGKKIFIRIFPSFNFPSWFGLIKKKKRGGKRIVDCIKKQTNPFDRRAGD